MTAPTTLYTHPGPMTSPGLHAALLQTLPRALPELTRAIQGLQIHEYMLNAYGVSVPDARKRESHLRRLEHMLGCMHARDPRPLAVPRAAAERSIGTCRQFSLLLVAALRSQGIPARVRVGFASYFSPGKFEDHWVGEYWQSSARRWVLVDAQLDELQRKHMNIDFDPLDVPHDRFLIAAQAWQRVRSGQASADDFGISPMSLHGLWFIAGDIIRDLAALNGVELLPWDVWGAMPGVNQPISAEQLPFLDRLAQVTANPEEHADELASLFATDPRVRPGATVWNDRTQAHEQLDAPPAGVALGD
jgi:hypothetical protein